MDDNTKRARCEFGLPAHYAERVLPEGFVYRPDFLSAEEERELLDRICALEFGAVRMHGVTARRRVAHYGYVYAYESFKVTPGPPQPEFLDAVRARAAAEAGVAAEELAETLVTEYPPGAAIGWHRDAPVFGIVVAIALGAPCRFKFRRGEGAARENAEVEVAPRSLYMLAGKSRTEWQHSTAPVKATRYSVTWRTLRRRKS